MTIHKSVPVGTPLKEGDEQIIYGFWVPVTKELIGKRLTSKMPRARREVTIKELTQKNYQRIFQ